MLETEFALFGATRKYLDPIGINDKLFEYKALAAWIDVEMLDDIASAVTAFHAAVAEIESLA